MIQSFLFQTAVLTRNAVIPNITAKLWMKSQPVCVMRSVPFCGTLCVDQMVKCTPTTVVCRSRRARQASTLQLCKKANAVSC